MSVAIDANDPRTIQALELAAEAGQWLVCRLRDGRQAFGVPSRQRPGLYYVVTTTTCQCPDFRRYGLSPARLGHTGEHRVCKHIMAVRLHCELVRATRALESEGDTPPATTSVTPARSADQRRGHLRLVQPAHPSTSAG